MKIKSLLLAGAKSALLSTLLAVPVAAADTAPTPNSFWFPDQIDLTPLRRNAPASNPYGAGFDYAAAFGTLDLKAVKADINTALTNSQPWWPADYGNYGPFFIRMAWHSAGTYRISDGRGGAGGGQQRFEPLNSWPDNGNLDKARRLLWPVKQKYGRAISWADLMVLTGNVALENMGFKTFGFAGGRRDDWEAEIVDWGPEKKFLDDQRYSGDRQLKRPLAAVQMGLIYVNPEGPNGNPDPLLAARDIRETFGRMAMDDAETVALIAGGHTFGKAHGAHDPAKCTGPAPAAEGTAAQGLGWINKCGTGAGKDAVTSGLEGAWSASPTQFTSQYLDNLFGFDWVLTTSPAGAKQWVPKNADQVKTVPDAHVPGLSHAPIMFTTDLSLKFDPAYRKIALSFQKDPKRFEDAFARAWFKLTHRDMGPRARYLGSDVPRAALIWQDPLPAVTHPLVTTADIDTLKTRLLALPLSNAELVRTAWASAGSYRGTDGRGGANGARLRLAPQKDWAVNNPAELARVLPLLEGVQRDWNAAAPGGRRISLADTIVLAGGAAIERAAKAAGHDVTVPFTPGRADASAADTDVASFAVLEPTSDPFRNHHAAGHAMAPVAAMIDRAAMLNLSPPEMTALVGGMRALGANSGGSSAGLFVSQPGTLSNQWFVNLLDMGHVWTKAATAGVYEGRDRASGQVKWTATPVDLVFGSHAELRAIAEAYAASDGGDLFRRDFVAAWTKVMNADRY